MNNGCLQRGRPACSALYEERHYILAPLYVDLPDLDGTMVLQTSTRYRYASEERLHIHLRRCLLGEGHEKGHLSDTVSGARVRWWVEEEDEEEEEVKV